jgi:hypothetical protein
MDSDRFDGLTRSVSTLLSRRTLAGVLGLGALAVPTRTEAKKHTHKKKKPKFNDFGCVNAGNFCQNSGQCCSGICQGQKGKKKCQAHDQSTCQSGQQEEGCGPDGGGVTVPCVSSTGDDGICETTTGKAGYCSADGQCFDCTKDADCVAFCGPQAACIVCADCVVQVGTETACVGPRLDVCNFPM